MTAMRDLPSFFQQFMVQTLGWCHCKNGLGLLLLEGWLGGTNGNMLKDYYQITKPRIIMSNLIATFGGYALATQWHVDWLTLFAAVIGTALVMACSTVMNNYLDRDLDVLMKRTEARALPMGRLKPSHVFGYAAALGIIGTVLLATLVNILTAGLGLLGMFVYIVIYTLWLKRHSTWSTSIGGISGAMPPVMGYTAAVGTLDIGAWLLFALLFLWQPPHFWSLGIRKREEYREAGFPLLPVVKGVLRTKIQMIPYIVLLIPATILFYQKGFVGYLFLIPTLVMNVYWLYHSILGFKSKDDQVWAKKNFYFSIIYLMVAFILMVVDSAV
jgi:protoheme IX farnesyltransferase